MVGSLGLERGDENKTAIMFKVKTVSLDHCQVKQKERKESMVAINFLLEYERNVGGRSKKA